jgi:hypothetical protein
MTNMYTFFLICAIFGGVILVCQFLLTLAGLGGHEGAGDHHFDFGHHGDTGADHGSTWFFNVLNFRALVAAITFLGLGGLAASSSPSSAAYALPIGIFAGGLAMVGVGYMMAMLSALQSEGNVHIEHAVGASGVVYLTIPPSRGGQGKVTIKIQNRTMEYAAVTEEKQALKTGDPVVVVGLAAPNVVQVEASR